MKKLLLSITAVAALTFSGHSQCTPDPQFTSSGVFPDSATGLATAYVGNAYDEVITVVVPADTIVGGTAYTFDRFDLVSFTGLPPNFGYVCNPTNCSFDASTSGCLSVTSSVNPTASDIGLYPLTIEVMPYVLVGGFPLQSPFGAVVVDYYFIEIADSAGMSVQSYNSESFELKTIFPNPVIGESKIQFISGKNQAATFTVTNVLGKTLVNRSIIAKRGVNELYVSAADFPNGIYLYSITADGKTSTKRMIIRK